MSFVAGIASAILVAGNYLGAGLVLWAINRILDGLDGVVARMSGRKTDLGGYLDLMYDFVVYSAIPLAFVYQGMNHGDAGPELYWGALVLFAAFYINLGSWTLLSALVEKRKRNIAEKATLTSLEMPWGVVEGTETVLVYSLFYIFPRFNAFLFSGFAILTLVGSCFRISWGIRNLKEYHKV